LQVVQLKEFIDNILTRMIFDGEKLTELFASFNLNWKERKVKELELMTDLVPQLKKIVQGRNISGLKAYE
jgi:type I restriction enzyme R subunit